MLKPLLAIDGIVNLILGVVLVAFPQWLVRALGIPEAEVAFYPSILGGVLFGIGMALLVESFSRGQGSGLGLIGAVSINLCGAAVLGGWLLFGNLGLPTRGTVILWMLIIILVGLSLFELVRARGPS